MNGVRVTTLAELRLERVAELLRGRDELAHAFGPVLLEAANGRGQEHRSRLEPELDRARPDRVDEVAAPGEQPEARSDDAVLVESRDADVGAELEGARLAEHRRADPRAAGVVCDDHDPALA